MGYPQISRIMVELVVCYFYPETIWSLVSRYLHLTSQWDSFSVLLVVEIKFCFLYHSRSARIKILSGHRNRTSFLIAGPVEAKCNVHNECNEDESWRNENEISALIHNKSIIILFTKTQRHTNNTPCTYIWRIWTTRKLCTLRWRKPPCIH